MRSFGTGTFAASPRAIRSPIDVIGFDRARPP